MMKKKKNRHDHVIYRNQQWKYPMIERGQGVYLYDEDGNRYLDFSSGAAVANLGHGNKEIAEYAKEQMERIAYTHLSRWTVDTIEDAAEKIASWAPGDLNHVSFYSSGSEVVEAAIKLARQYFVERDGSSHKIKVISKWGSFHGNSLGALSVNGTSHVRAIYEPLLIDSPKIPQFDHYRNPWGAEDLRETSFRSAQALEKEILRQGPENIMAFISEPVAGTALPGAYPDKIYFEMIREICDKYDVLWIDDEIMAGVGRTGKKMAVDHYGLVPDIITVSKGLGAGYNNVGALIANEKIFDTIMIKGSGSMKNGHTYAGNPLSAGIALKVLEIIERDKLIDNINNLQGYLETRLEELYKHPIVGDIRGKGFMYGLELVKDKETKEPFDRDVNIATKVTEYALEEGISNYYGKGTADGVNGDALLITPPFIIKKEHIDEYVEKMDIVLEKVCKEIL